jgi:hypothetical protein
MDGESTLVSQVRELAALQGISPTDDDIAGILDFLTRILPALEEIERRLPPETAL